MNFDKYISNDILFKKDIDWNISGAFVHDDLLMTFINSLRKNFGIKNPIASVHGSPPTIWGAGRRTQKLSKKKIISIIDSYIESGIKVYLTFSNHLVREKDLNDKESNFLLDKIAEQKNNGVIISSDELSKYIRDKYPYLTQIASIIKTDIYKGPRDKFFYDELTTCFDRIVVNTDDSLNFALLSSLKDANKIEIMLNDSCTYGCKHKLYHRNLFSALMKDKNIFLSKGEMGVYETRCSMGKLTDLRCGGGNFGRSRRLHFSQKEVNDIYDMGFRYFKLQGRNDHPAFFLYDLCRYMLNTNFAPSFYKSIYQTMSTLPKPEENNNNPSSLKT